MVEFFHFLMKNFVCTVYIDSLDQLSNQDMARRNVSFLDGVKPHPNTRIIVSMLPDEDETLLAEEEPKYWYGPHACLRQKSSPGR